MIFENLAFAYLNWTWVPSPQSIKKWRSAISKNCAVGDELTVGIAELKPKIVRYVLKSVMCFFVDSMI